MIKQIINRLKWVFTTAPIDLHQPKGVVIHCEFCKSAVGNWHYGNLGDDGVTICNECRAELYRKAYKFFIQDGNNETKA